MAMTQEQKDHLVTLLAKRLLNLEYQISNQDQMTMPETEQAIKDYEQDRDLMMQLILSKAKEMNYPAMTDWPDTKPMQVISQQSDNLLATTEAYQEILGQLILI